MNFRAARKSECRTIASLYSIASDGVADYVWTRLAEPGEQILDVGQRRYEQEQSVFSYRNCTVAEKDDRIAGILVTFPMRVDTDQAPESDPVLAPYSRLEEDLSMYVCGVAVFPEHQGQGIGSHFMTLAEQQAKAAALNKLSLLVFEQNTGACRLYERLGYWVKEREQVVPHPLILHTGEILLMVKSLPEL